MDPFLERFWNDVHGKLIAYIADELNNSLPSHYRATMQERVVISDFDQPGTNVRYPDVSVLELPAYREPGGVATAAHSSHLMVTSPQHLTYTSDLFTQYSIEILDTRHGEKVVTAIEILSPENKRPGDGMAQFRRKQQEYRSAKVSRVEIDFLREGRRMFEFPPGVLTVGKDKPYYITVHRGAKPSTAEVYAIDLRDSLPVISIPLREEESDAALDLQPLLNRAYHNGRFPIDYSAPCEPPLRGPDSEGAQPLLAAYRSGRSLIAE